MSQMSNKHKHMQAIAFFLSLLLAHPAIKPLTAEEFARKTPAAKAVAAALKESVKPMMAFFAPLRIARMTLVNGDLKAKEWAKMGQSNFL